MQNLQIEKLMKVSGHQVKKMVQEWTDSFFTGAGVTKESNRVTLLTVPRRERGTIILASRKTESTISLGNEEGVNWMDANGL